MQKLDVYSEERAAGSSDGTATQPAPAKIVQLDIQNVMRIKAVHIEPNGNVVVIGGKNAQGKTAALDSICMALGGLKFCPDMPIRKGEEKAEISLTLGDMSVTRKFWKGPRGDLKSSLSVKNAEGKPLSPPQQTLDAWIGPLAFDPLEFARMSPADARETLRELVGLDVSALEDELSRVYDSRTQAGQEKRAAQAVVDDMPVLEEVSDRVPTEAITSELAQCAQRQADFEELKAIQERHRTRIGGIRAKKDQLVREIEDAQARVLVLDSESEKEETAHSLAKSAVENFVNADADAIRERLDGALAHNGCVDEFERARDRHAEKVADATAAAEHWSELDAEHERIAQEIKDRTEAVEYPIPDLELRSGGVYYQGVPFGQGSLAERTKVSAVMGIAMNKGLGILLIRDGSVLDEDSMAMLAKIAGEHDMQFWIEMARGYEGVAGAVVIEDGSTL